MDPSASARLMDPRQEMIMALAASGPHSSMGEQARLFDRFVGTWDCDYVEFAADGSVKRFPGEVRFGWIIDGRALQDIWIWNDSAQGAAVSERGIGTSVRFLDSKSGLWRVVWVAPASNRILLLQGGAVGERIVLNGQDDEGLLRRWSFNDIRDVSFVWRGEVSRDAGQTWQLTAEYQLKRRADDVARNAAAGSCCVADKAFNDKENGMPASTTEATAATAASAARQDILLVRTLDAPVETVWKAWTDPDEVARWWGPKQYTSPFAKIDFREGGRYLFAMRAPAEHGGQESYVAGVYRKIVPMERIEMTQGLSDRDGSPIDPAALGMPVDFPREIPTVVKFKPVAGKTTVTVIESGWTPGQMLDYSEAGMSECLDKLAEALPKR